MHRTSIPVCLALAAFTLAFVGCWSRESPVVQGNREQILHRGLGADVADLDPHLITGLPEINVASTLFEGLVTEDPRDLHPVPGVALRWEISSDQLRYTFHLRPGASWSNGVPIVAQDFVASYQRVLTPSLGADYAAMLYVVQNAEAYNKGQLTDFKLVGFAAPDDHTLVITLEHPTPYFLSLLSHPVWFPVYLPALEKTGSPYQRGNPWIRPANFVGNGPFVLKSWQPDRTVIVEKSPTYWDANLVRLQAIHFHPSGNVDSEERAFRAGQLHVTEALPVNKVDVYRRDHPEFLRIDPFLDTYFYRLNVTRPLLNDRRIRQALSLAVDRKAIVENITRGGQEPAFSFTPVGTAGYEPPLGVGTDLATARNLLVEAGYPGGQGLPQFELLTNSSGNHRVIAEAVQEMWRRDLGINVTIVNMEQKSLLATRRTLDYQILRSDWVGDYLDPASFLEIFSSNSGNNHTGWSDPEYDNLLYQAQRTADRKDRYELFRRAETILLQAAPIIPLFYYTTVRLVHPAVRGWYPNLLDHHPYKYVWLEP
ncbi:MAG: peptide ABC transporter substrate-binding protein [Cephaloticoccus sp.]|nr:peptide ABC transporter substrate-binding protein [Cephaloticoccus sp.]MCF7761608.1 peptide ABC transporter substrate-binding protein [Cephaloticoccus sp.]